MNLNRPFILADRTPLVLHIERLRSSPPAPRSRWREAMDAAVLVAVWLMLGFCVVVMVAGVMVFACAAMGDGGGL